jgi:hypothetical protein
MLKSRFPFEEDLDRLIARKYKARLMNNTKWREVFRLLGKNDLQFAVGWVNDPDYTTEPCFRITEGLVEERGVRDPGIGGGGPFLFKELEYVRVPAVYRVPKMMRGEVYGYQEIRQDIKAFLAQLGQLGDVPLVVSEDDVKITGYI